MGLSKEKLVEYTRMTERNQAVAYYWEVGDPITDAVTHWMPLPEPPKKGYKNETT